MKHCHQDCNKCTLEQMKACLDMYYENSKKSFPCGLERQPWNREQIFEAMKKYGYEMYDQRELLQCMRCMLETALIASEYNSTACDMLTGALGALKLLSGGDIPPCEKQLGNCGSPCHIRVQHMKRIAGLHVECPEPQPVSREEYLQRRKVQIAQLLQRYGR